MIRRFSFTKLFLVASGLALATGLVAFAISCTTATKASDKIRVAVSILPQAEFVEAVGGERVEVLVMIPPAANPHTYEPTPSQIADLAEAEMYAKVGSGIEFELAWMDKLVAVNKGMLVVDCSKGVQFIEMVGEQESKGESHHGAMDPHIWMSPLNAKIMVQNICNGLIQIDPDNRASYEQNLDAYIQKLTRLEQDISNGLSGVINRRFMVYHPSFGYLAKDYNLIMIPIEEEGKEPTAAGIANLIKLAEEHNIRVIFVEPQFNPKSAEIIANEIGGKVVFVDPLARDYIKNLRIILGELIQAME